MLQLENRLHNSTPTFWRNTLNRLLEHLPWELFRVGVYPKYAHSLLPCLSKTGLERPGLERIGKLNDKRGIDDVGDDKKNAKRALIWP